MSDKRIGTNRRSFCLWARKNKPNQKKNRFLLGPSWWWGDLRNQGCVNNLWNDRDNLRCFAGSSSHPLDTPWNSILVIRWKVCCNFFVGLLLACFTGIFLGDSWEGLLGCPCLRPTCPRCAGFWQVTDWQIVELTIFDCILKFTLFHYLTCTYLKNTAFPENWCT